MRTATCFSFLMATVCLSVPTTALAHSDVLLRSDGTQVLIGAAEDLDGEEGGPFFDLETDVFEGVYIQGVTAPFNYDFERGEPGFYSENTVPVGQDLPANADVTISLAPVSLAFGTDSTFYWDGAGEIDFEPLSTAQPSVSSTFNIAQFGSTDGDSFMDNHPLFGLDGGAADGVYMTSYSIEVDSLLASDPFFIVWLADSNITGDSDAEEIEEALELFEEDGTPPIVGGVNYAFFEEAVEFAEGVPEPTSALLAVLAMVGLSAKRR